MGQRPPTTKGLPLIGIPDGDNQVASDDLEAVTSAPAPAKRGVRMCYDPMTGDYRMAYSSNGVLMCYDPMTDSYRLGCDAGTR